MEIRNNYSAPRSSQSFGMAMIMPKGKDLAKFQKYLDEGLCVQRGLKNFCKAQEKNSKFDIMYNYCSPKGDDSLGGVITIIPKEGVNAEPVKLKCAMERYDAPYTEKMWEVLDQYDDFVDSHHFVNNSMLAQLFAAVPYWIKDIGIICKAMIKSPEDFLPATLRKAGDLATKLDNGEKLL